MPLLLTISQTLLKCLSGFLLLERQRKIEEQKEEERKKLLEQREVNRIN